MNKRALVGLTTALVLLAPGISAPAAAGAAGASEPSWVSELPRAAALEPTTEESYTYDLEASGWSATIYGRQATFPGPNGFHVNFKRPEGASATLAAIKFEDIELRGSSGDLIGAAFVDAAGIDPLHHGLSSSRRTAAVEITETSLILERPPLEGCDNEDLFEQSIADYFATYVALRTADDETFIVDFIANLGTASDDETAAAGERCRQGTESSGQTHDEEMRQLAGGSPSPEASHQEPDAALVDEDDAAGVSEDSTPWLIPAIILAVVILLAAVAAVIYRRNTNRNKES